MTPSSSTNIETERLQLRPFVRGDLDDLTALNSDKEVMEYISSPLSREQVAAVIEALLQKLSLLRFSGGEALP